MHAATRGRVLLIAFAGLALLCGGGLAALPAQDPSDTPEQLELELERIRGQISALEARLVAMGEERVTLVDQFETADVELALSRRQLELIQLRLQALYTQRREREAEVERLAGELVTARQELAGRVVALYRMGPLSYSRFLLAADDPEDVLANYQLVSRLAAEDRALVTGISQRIEQHSRAVEAMNETVDRFEQTRREETLSIRELSAQQARRRELVRQIDIEAAAQRQAIEQQERSAAALETLLAEVSGQPAGAPDGQPGAGAEAGAPLTFGSARGALPWPAEGRITESFGRKVHPVYNTATLFKGIEIDAGAGTPVRAVFHGRVLFADWFQSYGLVVIVDHGDDFFTIYGHLDTLALRAGEWIEAGTEVGTVGETGSLIGPSLYFEIREGSDAVNPTLWLRRR